MGLLSSLRVCKRLTASVVNALEACEVSDSFSKTLRRKLKNIRISTQYTATDILSIDEGEPSKHVSFSLHNGTCSTKAICDSPLNSSMLNSAVLFGTIR